MTDEPLDLAAIKERCAAFGKLMAQQDPGCWPAEETYWFGVHARTDLPACIAEIERLWARMKELERQRNWSGMDSEGYT